MAQKNNTNKKLILGLKVKQLRLANKLSFSDLAEHTGLSVSYLNEIEKGKKFPKEDKLKSISNSLKVSFEELTSPHLKGGLAPVGELLKSNFLRELPLDLFGIELNKVVEIIASSPLKVGAFISTLVELSRTYEFKEESFYFRALRAYQEMHLNYFEDIEDEIEKFVQEFELPVGGAVPVEVLEDILSSKFGYTIEAGSLEKRQGLGNVRSIYNEKKRLLYLNGKMNSMQLAFQLGKELGFQYLKLSKRPYSSTFNRVKSFEEVLNNFKASYFSVGILINKNSILKDLEEWFSQTRLNPQFLINLSQKYKASSSVLFQRFNVLPQYFGIDKLFYLQTKYHLKKDSYFIDKELHLSKKHKPHANGLDETYCRRWLGVSALNVMKNNPEMDNLYLMQKSKYIGTDEEYLVVANGRKNYPLLDINTSVSVGMLLDDNARKTIRFSKDPNIPVKEVNVTCERCSEMNCQERAAPPIIIEKQNKQMQIEQEIADLLNS